MPNYNSTSSRPILKKPRPLSSQSPYLSVHKKGGRVGFKQGGAYGPLRGTTAGGVAKAFRGKAGFKESQALQKKLKTQAQRKQDTADRIKKFEHAGPREQQVITKRILGKKTKKGDRNKAAIEDAMTAKQSPWSNVPGSKKPFKKGGRA
jgi:hypothetical protein